MTMKHLKKYLLFSLDFISVIVGLEIFSFCFFLKTSIKTMVTIMRIPRIDPMMKGVTPSEDR